MATHSGILSWRIPWIEEPGRLQFIGLQRVGHAEATEQANIITADSWKAYPHAKSTQMTYSLLILENTRVLLSVHCKVLSSQWGRHETSTRRPQLFSTTPRSV